MALTKKGIYQGLIYREAVGNLNYFSKSITNKKISFAGQCFKCFRRKIIQHLIAADQAKIYWDSDQTFLNDPYHDAGLFVRRFKKVGSSKSNPLNGL
jgi:hypothetical protein